MIYVTNYEICKFKQINLVIHFMAVIMLEIDHNSEQNVIHISNFTTYIRSYYKCDEISAKLSRMILFRCASNSCSFSHIFIHIIWIQWF